MIYYFVLVWVNNTLVTHYCSLLLYWLSFIAAPKSIVINFKSFPSAKKTWHGDASDSKNPQHLQIVPALHSMHLLLYHRSEEVSAHRSGFSHHLLSHYPEEHFLIWKPCWFVSRTCSPSALSSLPQSLHVQRQSELALGKISVKQSVWLFTSTCASWQNQQQQLRLSLIHEVQSTQEEGVS